MIQSLTPRQITDIVQGQLLGPSEDALISMVSIDSRNILQPDSTLFVALKGAKFDGHTFVPSLLDLGVSCFLVKNDFPDAASMSHRASFILVDNTHAALHQLAAYQRSLFKNPLVGITGSNGKTIVKEWLGQVLGRKFPVAKSPKSYNSQVGVPLSVFGIHATDKAAIMEAGISKQGEMSKLEAILKPEIGIFTNIGTAHEEGFPSMEEKLKEKALLFDHSKFVICRKEHAAIHQHLLDKLGEERLIVWSDDVGCDYTLTVRKDPDHAKILLMRPDLSIFTFSVPFLDEASLENIRHVIVASLTLGLEPTDIQEGISHLKAVEMRLTLKPGINDCLLIDDTYNNDLAGLRLALDFMSAQRPKDRKVVILSDMLQVGKPQEVYQKIAELLQYHRVDFLVAVGQHIRQALSHFQGESRHFADTKSLVAGISELNFENDLILITGAREFRFEQIVDRLQQRIHGTTLEINLNALTHNYNFYKSKILPHTKIMVMVKAFAYGGGAAEIANHLQQMGADYLAVAYTDEGVALREAGIKLPIMVLNPVQESFIHLQQFHLEPVVYSLDFFKQLGKYCRHQGTDMHIHLDFDTGMHRLGFEMEHLQDLKTLIIDFPELRIASMYTHLVGADEEAHHDFSIRQLEDFLKMCSTLESALGYRPLRHALNSAGIVRYPEYQMDMVRLGIGLYGVEVSGLYEGHLKPISSLKTTVSQVKHLKAGETIGYSRKGKMEQDGQIATIAIGYADGYDRRFSNGRGFVLIHGHHAPVIGNVCMDMTMLDVTGLEVREGDEVLIYGPGISLKELAERIGTIPYELLTNISSRVKRVYYLD